jgi:hypothetical protein
MKAYATYSFYTDTYGGAAAESEFNRRVYKASRFLDKITFDRAAAVTDPDTLELLAYAVCEMADQLTAEAAAAVDGKTVKSVSNDGYSVSFVTEADGGTSLTSQRLYSIAEGYLPTELLSFVTGSLGAPYE